MTTDRLNDGNAKHGAATRVDAVDFDIFGGDAEPVLSDADDTIARTIAPGTKLDFDLAGSSEPPLAVTAGFRADDSDMYAEDATRFSTGALPSRGTAPSPIPAPVATPVAQPPAPNTSNLPVLILAAVAVVALLAVGWWFLR